MLICERLKRVTPLFFVQASRKFMGIAWLNIKAEYLQGVTPKELAEKYNVAAKTIHEKASKEGWVIEKTSISKNLQEKTEEQIKAITQLALRRLEGVLNDENIKTNDLVSAIGKALDISGLKSFKQEIDMADSLSINVIKKD